MFLSSYFPRLFPEYYPAKETLCRVIAIARTQRGGDAHDWEIAGAMFVTIEDSCGARGRLDTYPVLHNEPLNSLQEGDQVVVVIKQKMLFKFEMKIVKLKEIYPKGATIPVRIAA